MFISGFSFIRNGNRLNYPYREALLSILPICDELVVAVGNSDDGTREAIIELNEPKIKIIDTVWDDALREGGRILAQQTNIALDAIKGKWGFYIQGDEVIHENDLTNIHQAVLKHTDDEKVEGLLFDYLHFYGNFNFIRDRMSKRAYPHEIRLVKNNPNIRSYRDAQGFRKFIDPKNYENEEGKKLNVVKVNATVFHYGMVRSAEKELERQKEFHKLWHGDDWVAERFDNKKTYDYNDDVPLERFTGSHPTVMQKRIAEQNWNFNYDASKVKEKLKYKLTRKVGKIIGKRLFDYRNYNVVNR